MRVARKRMIISISSVLAVILFGSVFLFSAQKTSGVFTAERYSNIINNEISKNKNIVGASNSTDSTTNNKDNVSENHKKLESDISSVVINSLTKDIEIEDFVNLRERVELHSYLWREIFGEGPYNADTFQDASFLIQSPKQLVGYRRLLASLHQSLYPWLYKRRFYSTKNLFKSYNGRGIVICAGNGHFKFAISTIDALRNIIESELPIEIFYNGDGDLSIENRKKFQEYKDVYLSDISQYFDNEPLRIGGWAIKPFSVLASRFQEVILMDADAMYIRDPAILFEDEGYIQTGTVFFRDRTLFPGSHPGSKWLKSWMVDPLPETRASRFWNELTSHEMESSTVVIDKSRTILGILAVCKFNEQQIRDDVVYKRVHGDKETFWMGFDMARQHYNEVPLPSVFVGEEITGAEGDDPTKEQLCGHVGHLARDGHVLFWNDHIVKDKTDERYNDRLLNFKVYLIEDTEADWPTFHCMNLDGRKTTPFDDEEKEVINKIISRERMMHFVVSGKYEDELEKNGNLKK
ncbi:hypothetical protein BCR32DRAFT_137449 [Anaeromyces robustus]|uniref:Nucleotide-diphospho-sugar transferase n=1 Tax=Anaeromyces robustus TaxID=1754192 RepID=A0A1Y1XF77_9FUNG|nr:hypothetical protein BCR32DRAFT_137449 [Anaeromyces robustus]|eukprot:ORX84014.1 hypothetical protein BCR32DRAFT_137449 [Anaeromyces robustus]